jgi:hypothetical protein
MPEPQSQRGNVITEAAFEAPFSTPLFPFGVGGVRLDLGIDYIPVGQYANLTNAYYTPEGAGDLTTRAGLTALATFAGSQHHSVIRLLDPTTGATTRIWGCGTSIARGLSGALTSTDVGYSGLPLSLVTHRPPLSSSPYVYVGDSARNRKIRADGLVLPIGLPAPTIAASTVLGTLYTVPVIPWTGSTAHANWTANPGTTYGNPPVEVPAGGVFDTGSGTPNGDREGGFGTSTESIWVDDTVPNAYNASWGVPVTINLGTIGGVPASDDDFFHLWLQYSHADLIEEFRIYIVVSSVFSPSIVPGLPNDTNANMDFYVKSFSMNDFASFIQTAQTQLDAAERARVHMVRDDSIEESSQWTGRGQGGGQANLQVRKATLDPTTTITPQAGAGNGQWIELGVVGNPLRRGDFQRIGATEGRNWSTVTGIVCWVRVAPKSQNVLIRLGNMYLHGGSGPDSAEPGESPYDYRYTHYDPRTGAEGNPSPEQSEANYLDSARRAIVVTPSSYGDSAVRQRFYRRGGTLVTDWYFAGENFSDGGPFADVESDLAIAAAGTVQLDYYQPVPTVTASGATVLAQPLTSFFGPVNGQLLGTGNPYAPGFVYASLPGQPEMWPPDLAHEVCSPSEELLMGLVYGAQPYVFSRDRLYAIYPNLSGAAGLTSTPTSCTRGPVARWAYAVGAGAIWFRASDGIFRTTGGAEERVSGDLQPFFDRGGQEVHGYRPPSSDVANLRYERLAIFDNELWWSFMDTNGAQQTWVFQIPTQQWRHYTFQAAGGVNAVTNDEGNPVETLIVGGLAGTSYTHEGVTDAGVGIPVQIVTGALNFGRPREEKLFGDQILDADGGAGINISLQNALNMGTVVNPVQGVTVVGNQRAIFDGFGILPQRARDIQTTLSWVSTNGAPTLHRLGTSLTAQPDLTINRVSNWDDLGSPDESYVMGVTFDADTGGSDREIVIERDWGGVITPITTLTINHDGRHKKKYSWPALPANQVRIRPDDTCVAWILYRADWIAFKEPPRIADWDIHFENQWDQYLTGLDLYCDTNNATKRIVVEVDGTALVDPATGFEYWDISTAGRQVVHLTLPWLRGHVLHFYAVDDNPGLLYNHRWHTEAEPSEQANWNQPFTILGTQADKWLKAVIFEVDTFGEDKSVRVEADGAVVTTLTVNTTGRKVVQLAIPQALGRVWRFFPIDSHPSRLYTLRPVFDEEPFQLDRWETQETNHGQAEFQTLIEGQITLKSSAEVTLTVYTYVNQTGTILEDTYAIPSTAGVKLTRYVPFVARKGVLFKYLFTCGSGFWLYQEESHIVGELWVSGNSFTVKPFGNSDADPTRSMVNTTLAAARSGGSAN